jgi:RimJ/RimL family protein N-acetyltransferase
MIRPATRGDDDAIWRIFREVVGPGDTYVFDPRISVVGTYILKLNQPALGSHVANAAVVSTNEAAVRLWKHLGFRIVGTLPGAFRHTTRGYVDAYVMFQDLAGTRTHV